MKIHAYIYMYIYVYGRGTSAKSTRPESKLRSRSMTVIESGVPASSVGGVTCGGGGIELLIYNECIGIELLMYTSMN